MRAIGDQVERLKARWARLSGFEWAGTIAKPTYYSPNFSDAERAAIDEETRATAARFGYPD